MIHYTVKNQWEVVLESLLEKGVDVNCTTNKGVTPLMMASSRNHCNMVMALLKHNADISIENKVSITLLRILNINKILYLQNTCNKVNLNFSQYFMFV